MAEQQARERKRRQEDESEEKEQLVNSVGSLASAIGRPPPSSASITAWYLALAGYAVLFMSFAAVLIAVLADRSRQHGKPTPGGKHAVFSREEANPTNWELLNDCPGGHNANADKCTFEAFLSTANVYGYKMSNVVRNCASSAAAAMHREMKLVPPLGVQYSMWKSAQVGGTEGDRAPDGIEIAHEWIEKRKKKSALPLKEEHAVSPATQAAILVQQRYVRHIGRVRVNYGHKLARHYVWYVEDFNIDVPEGDPIKTVQTWDCRASPELDITKYNANFSVAQIS